MKILLILIAIFNFTVVATASTRTRLKNLENRVDSIEKKMKPQVVRYVGGSLKDFSIFAAKYNLKLTAERDVTANIINSSFATIQGCFKAVKMDFPKRKFELNEIILRKGDRSDSTSITQHNLFIYNAATVQSCYNEMVSYGIED